MLSTRTDPLRILLVDDDEDDCALTRDLVSQMRSPMKAELRWASSYEAGLLALRQPWCEVCLLDYLLMPTI
jgi:DNA-binding NtrC family response regulator